jgi:hypothetical protein
MRARQCETRSGAAIPIRWRTSSGARPVVHAQWRTDDIEIPLYRAVTIVLTNGLDGNVRTTTLHI